ncbi:iron-sulfur cluster carrier protein [Armatimonadota bacterium]|nr:iron-sulfur cluster carrier protein [Armatimonadota bacterium]
MAEITEELIREALRAVKDPDLNRDIVALGFVQEIRIDGGTVAFKIELTTPACPVKDELKAQAEQIVLGLAGVTQVDIEMTAIVRGRALDPQEVIPGVRHIIAVASGKGGVGKSTISVALAVALAKMGAEVGLLDCDIYGPSIPMMMGISQDSEPQITKVGEDLKMSPILAHGVHVMSLGFILKSDQAVVWRGPMLGKAVRDMLTGCVWGDLDYLIVDLPPGTGDVPMSLTQLVPISGVVVVTTPQYVAQEIARKSIAMFRTLSEATKRQIPILGMIENMSGGMFGTGGGEQAAERFDVPFLGRIPMKETISLGGDTGYPAVLSGNDTEIGGIFMSLAQNLAAKVSILQYASENR